MILNTKYHGTKEYKEEDIIVFKKGILGFEDCKRYILFNFQDNDVFKILHSIEDPNLGFVLVSPFVVTKDYEFELSEEKEKELEITSEADIMVLNTVTVNSNIEKATTNLKAPIIINIKNRLGEQIVLETEKYSLKHPFVKIES